MHSPQKIAVHFGAGNIGRGFIGALLAAGGYRVVFADVNAEVISALQAEGEYRVFVLDEASRTETVTGVTGLLSSDAALTDVIASADLITTAVGPNVLPRIAGTIATGLAKRAAAGGGFVNVIACENKVGASDFLAEHVLAALPAEAANWAAEKVGFPNASVDRIVPPFHGEKLLDVGVEEFFEWNVERAGFKGEPPHVDGMNLVDNLTAYVQRKLYTLNTGHATAAYVGKLHGAATVAEAMAMPNVAEVVFGAMRESGAALVKTHCFDPEAHEAYIQKIARRFVNPHIHDEVARVGREPLRKLSEGERLIGPMLMAQELGLPYGNLAKAAAAALQFSEASDEQSVQLAEMLQHRDKAELLAELTGQPKDGEIVAAILRG